MKMRNVAIALFLAVATFSTTAIFSQNENNNDELSVSNDQLVMDGWSRGGGDVLGVWVPD
jgi:hypothetical protein